MMYTVYYYVVSKTYSAGDAPHQLELHINFDHLSDQDKSYWPNIFFLVCCQARPTHNCESGEKKLPGV